MAEIYHPFASDDIFGPMQVYKAVKFKEIKRFAAEIYKRTDTILFRLTFTMMMVVMMVMAMLVMAIRRIVVTLIVVVMFPMICMVMLLMIRMVMMLLMIFICMRLRMMRIALQLFISGSLDFLYPSGGGGYIFKIKKMSVNEFVERHIAVITFYNFCFRLQLADYGFNFVGLRARYFVNLIEKYYVAEFKLAMLFSTYKPVLAFAMTCLSKSVANIFI